MPEPAACLLSLLVELFGKLPILLLRIGFRSSPLSGVSFGFWVIVLLLLCEIEGDPLTEFVLTPSVYGGPPAESSEGPMQAEALADMESRIPANTPPNTPPVVQFSVIKCLGSSDLSPSPSLNVFIVLMLLSKRESLLLCRADDDRPQCPSADLVGDGGQ